MANRYCPRCGSDFVEIQLIQKGQTGRTVTRTRHKYKQQRNHGILWWLFIGWWWWMFDLMFWILLFPFRAIYGLLKRKTFVGTSRSVSTTRTKVHNSSVCLCKDCGYYWELG